MPSGGIADIEIGSYTGSGKYGSSNKNSLTFGHVPKLVIIRPSYTVAAKQNPEYIFVWITGMTVVTAMLGSGAGTSNTNSTVSISGQTITWYCPSNGSAEYQFNKSDTTYIYFAVG